MIYLLIEIWNKYHWTPQIFFFAQAKRKLLCLSLLFLSSKANARVKLANSGHGPHLFRIIVFFVVLVIVLYYCLYAFLLLCCTVTVLLCYYLCCPMYWLCVLYHCHRVLTQLQLTNISIFNSAQESGECDGEVIVFATKMSLRDHFTPGQKDR